MVQHLTAPLLILLNVHLATHIRRNVPERSLGLVADRCTHLRFLKVYGCSQLTALFVHGHSNEALQHIKGLGPLETYTVAAVEG